MIAVSGHPGCRYEEVARIAAQRLRFELLNAIPAAQAERRRIRRRTRRSRRRLIPALVTSILARLATEHHIVYCAVGGELQARHFPGMLRVHVVAPENIRIGNLMLDHRLERPAARQLLLDLEAAGPRRSQSQVRQNQSHRRTVRSGAQRRVAHLRTDGRTDREPRLHPSGLEERGFLSAAAEAQLQFQMRLRLARFGLAPPGNAALRKKIFAHQSEEMFANLLDFYRIAWEYEPRSFPIQYGPDGNVLEAFTPDFYLPEFDLYVELTTMKQSLVTRKNRKVRLLRELYPHLNIQVFYQKDFENLIFKYGLAERPVQA